MPDYDYDNGYNDGLSDGFTQGKDEGINEQAVETKEMEFLYNDKCYDYDVLERCNASHVRSRDETICELEKTNEDWEVKYNDLELEHDHLDCRYENLIDELKRTWPDAFFDLVLKEQI